MLVIDCEIAEKLMLWNLSDDLVLWGSKPLSEPMLRSLIKLQGSSKFNSF